MPGEIHHVGFVIMSRMSWGMYGHYIVSAHRPSPRTLPNAIAIDTLVLHIDLLVRYPSGMGWSSRQSHARCDVTDLEELAKQIPR